MARVPRPKHLQVEQDLTYQRREWLFERVGWVAIALVIVAALLGLLGSGPLNSGGLDPEPGVRLEFERRLHYGTPSELLFRVGGDHVADGQCRLWLSKEYLDRVHLKEVLPAPDHVEAGPDGQTFVFRTGPERQPVDLRIRIEAEKAGPLPGRARVGDGPAFGFDQFVYP